MNFGQALEELKSGKNVAREGWNGKGMYLWLKLGVYPLERCPTLIPSSVDGIPFGLFLHSGASKIDDIVTLPHICMRTASGSVLDGWLASQTDMLADDWQVVD